MCSHAAATGTLAGEPTEAELLRDADEWENWPSAMEEKEDLHRLIREAESKGFCSVVPDVAQAEALAGGKTILNNLGVIVKTRAGKRKSRIIWDLRESGVNLKCDQAAGLLREEHGHRLVREFWADEVTSTMEVVTDASPWGMGGILYENKKPVRWFATHLTPELLMKFGASTADSGFNTLWEAVALLIACRLWLGRTIRGFGVRLRSDNVGALRAFFKLAAGSSNLNLVAREVALDLALKNYRLTELSHIPGITNVAADALSRSRFRT